MKKSKNESLNDDILKVCIDFYNHANQKSLQYICVGSAPSNHQTISCNKHVTPYNMKDMGLLSNLESFNDIQNQSKLNSISFLVDASANPTLLRVKFNGTRIIQYLAQFAPKSIKNHIKEVGKYDVWKDSFRFEKHKLYLPPYLTLTFSETNGVNIREKFIEIVANGKMEGRGEWIIKNKLSDLCRRPITDLSAIITSLNKKRFSKAKGALIRLTTFIKEDKKKHIRIQVVPTTHKV